jgi:hypothetical protein
LGVEKRLKKSITLGGGMCFWFIPKTASMASSSTGALVAAGSLQPQQRTACFRVGSATQFFELIWNLY